MAALLRRIEWNTRALAVTAVLLGTLAACAPAGAQDEEEEEVTPLEGCAQRDRPDASMLERAKLELSPHHVAFYLRELAGELHSYYFAHKWLLDDNEALKLARLALAAATRQVLRNGLALIGVSAPEKM